MAKKKKKSPRRPAASRPNSTGGALGAVAGAVLTLLLVAVIAWIEDNDSALYLRIVQEDEILEWGTVWAFLGAMGIFFFAAYRKGRDGRGKESRLLPFFLGGLGFFCFLFAMEEISWGQRILGYRPPTYFLEHNFQQELNLHNIVDTDLRKLTLQLILLGYGILLPLFAMSRKVRALLAKVGIVAPPWQLIPVFATALYLYVVYPWDFNGEVVELIMGFGFLFAALHTLHALPAFQGRSKLPRWVPAAAAFVLVLLLGWINASVSSAQRSGNPETVATARQEVEALRRDFQAMADARGGRLATKCGLHKRVFSYVEKYDKDELYEGTFASLTAQGLPEDRADYFIDPWNSPYWIRHRCSKDRQRIKVFVYSFGPNRRRDSDRWNIFEDDVGAMIFERGE